MEANNVNYLNPYDQSTNQKADYYIDTDYYIITY